MQYSRFYTTMADGTIKQINPFTDTEVWSVPGRSAKPAAKEEPNHALPLTTEDFTNFCSFCSGRVFETPPEKARLLNRDHSFGALDRASAETITNNDWLFRRVPNLFEIVTVDYWKKNYSFVISPENLEWKERYLTSPLGAKHVRDVMSYKLLATGSKQERIDAMTDDELALRSDAFFGGSHELITANPHFRPGAENNHQLFGSGDFSPEDHAEYFRFTIRSMADIIRANRYVRYVSVFQNWLTPAGASFDHLHKQMVGIDDWGASIRHQIEMLRDDRNVFNMYAANLAGMHNLIFAENDYAIAFAGIGHRHPTIEIFSKSYFSRPYEHSQDEVRGMSDLVHACHAATGSTISSNEEWYYSPVDAIYKMPWHVLIKWRINTAAGFEGGTSIYINPMTPLDLRDRIVPSLYKLRDDHKIAGTIRIAEECRITPNPLRYYLD